MIAHFKLPSAARAALLAVAFSLSLAACAQGPGTDRVASTSPTAGSDVVGGGGHMDQVYRQIYTPGNAWWSQL